ncbi:MAG TPA: hypothetical protein VN616_18840, partial [Puia sp.]|nr:hypothetical protein [Puia sp.]
MYRMMLRFPCLVVLLLSARLATAQNDSLVRFRVAINRVTDSSVDLVVMARIADSTRLYGLRTDKDTSFYSGISFYFPLSVRAVGDPIESGAVIEARDTTMGGPVRYATGTLRWRQRFVVHDTAQVTIKGKIAYSYLHAGTYLSGEYDFKAFVTPPVSAGPAPSGNTGIAGRSLLWIFLAAFGGGLLALLTPCVYSMIPITVSFFTKRSRTRAEGRR